MTKQRALVIRKAGITTPQARQVHVPAGESDSAAGVSENRSAVDFERRDFNASVLDIVACPFTKQRLLPNSDDDGSMHSVRSRDIDVVWPIMSSGLLNMIPADASTSTAQQPI